LTFDEVIDGQIFDKKYDFWQVIFDERSDPHSTTFYILGFNTK
jgi:hypothetical protein